MAITGTFLADFTQFDSAVQGAGAKLRAFEGEAGKSGQALQSMETSSQTLSGRMIALGSAVGSFIGNFAANTLQAGVSSLIAMGQEAFTSAGRILDLSNKTGLTAETIQRMQFVADQTGGSLEQFTQAAFQLGTRLSGGSGSVQKAVEELGLSFRALQQMRPDQMWETVIAALGRVDDATKRNELGQMLFGRTFATMAAGVSEGYEKLADSATVSSDAQLEALDKLADRWKAFTTTTTTNIQAFLGQLVIAFEEADLSGAGFIEMHRRLKDAFVDAGAATEDYDSQLHALGIHLGTVVIPKQDSYTAQLTKTKAEIAALSTEQIANIRAAKDLGVSVEDLTADFGVSEGAVRLLTERFKEQETASDKVTAAIKRMTDAQKTYLDIVLPGTSKAAELERSRAEQAGQHAKFTAEGLKTLTFLEEGLGTVQDSRATGALAMHLAEQTAMREQTEALALVDQQMTENFTVVGEYATANTMAGAAAKAATHEAVQGYAAVASQVTLTGDAIRAYIELQKYSAAANAILQENTLFTSRSQLERISKLPMGGSGGGATTVNVNVSGVMDARTQDEIGRVVSSHLTRSVMQGTKFS